MSDNMYRLKRFTKSLLTPVTIMLVPHCSKESTQFRVPTIVLVSFSALSLLGLVYIGNIAHDAFQYRPTKKQLDYYKGQFTELEATITSLTLVNKEFKTLFALESREEVLENMHATDSGALDMEYLRKQINKTIDTVGEIRDYLSEAKDLYMATPMGLPGDGWITSKFGYRIHPIKGTRDFHTGMDISVRPGLPVRATADGIVSFAGRSGANGNLVALEHGFGYSTYYAHNKKNNAIVGQVVKRGDVIAYVGSTGSSTGPHIHYEIWKDGKEVDPAPYAKGGKWYDVLKEQ